MIRLSTRIEGLDTHPASFAKAQRAKAILASLSCGDREEGRLDTVSGDRSFMHHLLEGRSGGIDAKFLSNFRKDHLLMLLVNQCCRCEIEGCFTAFWDPLRTARSRGIRNVLELSSSAPKVLQGCLR